MPGKDWTNTVFEHLYFTCHKNQAHAAKFFGLLVFNILLNRTDKTWCFGRFEKDGVPISSMTYFVKKE